MTFLFDWCLLDGVIAKFAWSDHVSTNCVSQAEPIGLKPEDIYDPLFHGDAAASKVNDLPHASSSCAHADLHERDMQLLVAAINWCITKPSNRWRDEYCRRNRLVSSQRTSTTPCSMAMPLRPRCMICYSQAVLRHLMNEICHISAATIIWCMPSHGWCEQCSRKPPASRQMPSTTRCSMAAMPPPR